MCWKVPFLRTECSSGSRNEGKCWKHGIWVEAWSWKQASVLNCSTLEATWRRNGHIGCRVRGCLLAERVRYGMAGLEGEKTLTWAVLRARRIRWELPSQTLEASAWWNCSLGMCLSWCAQLSFPVEVEVAPLRILTMVILFLADKITDILIKTSQAEVLQGLPGPH